MADHLYVSYWLKNYSGLTMLRQFKKMLELLPVSPKNPANSILRIEAVDLTQAPLLERPFTDPLDIEAVIEACNEHVHNDCAYTLETWWGMWQYGKDWQLLPGRISLHCFGTEFADAPLGSGLEGDGKGAEHLRIDFGLDSAFLPQPELPNALYYAQSNLKSLLQFVSALDSSLQAERRMLWSESGENFAEKLKSAAADLV